MPRLDLSGASAIVTGGASGIGEASARQLADAGAHVVVADLQEDLGVEVASSVGGLFVRCDVTSVDDASAAVDAASEMGPLRALVNSAGLGRAGRTIDRNNVPMDLEQFRFVIKRESDRLVQHAGPSCLRNGQDRTRRRRRIPRRRREHGLGRRVRRSDRPGRVLRLEGRCGGHDAAHRPRPFRHRHSRQHPSLPA